MAVAEILVLVPLVRLGGIVGGGIRRRFDDGPGVELQGDVAAQANRAGEVGSGGEITVPPPAAAAASIALLMASRSSVLPSALAPNALTSKTAARVSSGAPNESARAAKPARTTFDIPSPWWNLAPHFGAARLVLTIALLRMPPRRHTEPGYFTASAKSRLRTTASAVT